MCTPRLVVIVCLCALACACDANSAVAPEPPIPPPSAPPDLAEPAPAPVEPAEDDELQPPGLGHPQRAPTGADGPRLSDCVPQSTIFAIDDADPTARAAAVVTRVDRDTADWQLTITLFEPGRDPDRWRTIELDPADGPRRSWARESTATDVPVVAQFGSHLYMAQRGFDDRILHLDTQNIWAEVIVPEWPSWPVDVDAGPNGMIAAFATADGVHVERAIGSWQPQTDDLARRHANGAHDVPLAVSAGSDRDVVLLGTSGGSGANHIGWAVLPVDADGVPLDFELGAVSGEPRGDLTATSEGFVVAWIDGFDRVARAQTLDRFGREDTDVGALAPAAPDAPAPRVEAVRDGAMAVWWNDAGWSVSLVGTDRTIRIEPDGGVPAVVPQTSPIPDGIAIVWDAAGNVGAPRVALVQCAAAPDPTAESSPR